MPSGDPELLRLRSLTGFDGVETGLFLPIEGQDVRPTSFDPPDAANPGDATGCLLLYDAARLSLRSGAAPFQSLGRISVTPRPYQFVPLIMALRMDPVRLLIADDVGVGKTIEAAMIARELLDRGVVKRLAVVCPSHLCDQWERELREKFAIEAVTIQPSTIARLERQLPRQDLSIYQHYPYLVCSIDFVKSPRHRGHFLQNAPDLVIVDEAHLATRPRGSRGRSQQQRHELLRGLAADGERHLLLFTATPHSGIEESFRSLLGILDRKFDIQDGEEETELDRRQLLPHFVQRRRADLKNWLGMDTPFPERISEERTYPLSSEYQKLFEDILKYCRETVQTTARLGGHQQRVRYWAMISLLRCILSIPAAAVAALSERARKVDTPSDDSAQEPEDLDDVYRLQIDDSIEEGTAGDYVPSAALQDAQALLSQTEKRRLGTFQRRAEALEGPDTDRKLEEAAKAVAIGVLLDASGSMEGPKFEAARVAAAMLHLACSELGIWHAVVAFEGGRTVLEAEGARSSGSHGWPASKR